MALPIRATDPIQSEEDVAKFLIELNADNLPKDSICALLNKLTKRLEKKMGKIGKPILNRDNIDLSMDVLTLDEAAALLRLGKRTVYGMCKEGTIPVKKIGQQWRFHRAKIMSWVEEGGNTHGHVRNKGKQ